MVVITPTPAQTRELQEAEGAYHLSRAFDVVLRKHGYIQARSTDVAGWRGEPGFVTRMTPWDPRFADVPLVFEAPLHPTIAEQLQCLRNQPVKATEVLLSTGESDNIGYTRFTVRFIPKVRGQTSDPFPFISEDSKWNSETFPLFAVHAEIGWTPIMNVCNLDRKDVDIPICARRGKHIVVGFPLLDVLSSQHAFPPLKDAGYFTTLRAFEPLHLERHLLGEAARMFVEYGHPLVRMTDWISGKSACLSVRHDYDRRIPMSVIEDLIDYYDCRGISSTWFWLNRNSDTEQARRLHAAGHEIALHSEAGTRDAFSEEVKGLEEWSGAVPAGVTAHGGMGSTGFLGMTTYDWVRQSGMHYAETLGKRNTLPHHAIVLADGLATSSGVALMVTHDSVDSGMKPDQHRCEFLRQRVPELLGQGGMCILMNHPDIHVPQLKDLLDRINLSTVWTANIRTILEWITAAKHASRVMACPRGFEVTFPVALPEDTVLELLRDGNCERFTLPRGTRGADLDLSTSTCAVRAA